MTLQEKLLKKFEKKRFGPFDENKPKYQYSKRQNKRNTLLKRDGNVCGICKLEIVDELPTIDHIVEKILGGTDNNKNLRLAHKMCNENRGKETWSNLKKIKRMAHSSNG